VGVPIHVAMMNELVIATRCNCKCDCPGDMAMPHHVICDFSKVIGEFLVINVG